MVAGDLINNTQKTVVKDEASADERLFHEINLLRLEGYYFCLDPKEASRRRGKREFQETLKIGADAMEQRPVVIAINPEHGQPSTTAYKVLQAIIKKLSDRGLPIANTVYFSQRELARMMGHTSYGGTAQKQSLQAIMQLRDTKILCWMYMKETDTWAAADFQILDAVIFSGKAQRVTQCAVRLNDLIVKSLNSRYTICLNYTRLQELEPIGVALYKHLFYHFSNIYSGRKHQNFTYNKNYADICNVWLGGLKVLPFRSKILQEQLGRHLEALKAIKLIRTYSLEKNAKGDGFTLELSPGSGFFEDFEHFYKHPLNKSAPPYEIADDRKLQEPLAVVHYFYSKLYPDQNSAQPIYSDKEADFAKSLLETYTEAEIKDLVDFTLEEAGKSQFQIKTFGGIRGFISPWLEAREAREAANAKAAAEAQQKAREALLMHRYNDFRETAIERAKATLAPEELKALESHIREQISGQPGPAYAQDLGVRVRINTEIAKRCNILSFDEWKAQMVA